MAPCAEIHESLTILRGPGMEEAILYPLPPPADVVPRRLTDSETARVELLCRLLFVSIAHHQAADITVPCYRSHQVVDASSKRELSQAAT